MSDFSLLLRVIFRLIISALITVTLMAAVIIRIARIILNRITGASLPHTGIAGSHRVSSHSLSDALWQPT